MFFRRPFASSYLVNGQRDRSESLHFYDVICILYCSDELRTLSKKYEKLDQVLKP